MTCPGGRTLSDAEALRALLFETCGDCEGNRGQMHVHTVAVPGHHPGCGGQDCESLCPVPEPMPVEEWEQCDACGGSGQTPKDGGFGYIGETNVDELHDFVDDRHAGTIDVSKMDRVFVIPTSTLEGDET
jgi:hypothetical protein